MAAGAGDRRWVVGLTLVVAGVFAQVVGFELLIYDDDRYVGGNPVVQRGLTARGVAWAFSSFHEGTWQPLTWLTHMADVALWGDRVGGHHLTNLLLHLATVVLLLVVLRRATGRFALSLAIALLWAVHPLQVQSVAWVAERKGLLATFFGLLALFSFHEWVLRRRGRDLLLLHLFFAASLLSKPSWAVLPLLLLAWERWPLRREISWRARLGEKAALFAMAALGAAIAARAQAAAGALSSLEEVGLGLRVANALVAFERTLRRMVLPADLAAFHPFRFELPPLEIGIGALLLVGGTWLVLRVRHTHPGALTGWIWTVLTFLPTSGLVRFGGQGTADRFAVLPLLGVLLAVSAIVESWARRSSPRAVALGTAAVAGLAIAVTLRVLPSWHDTVRLFERNLQVAGGSVLVHTNLGIAYERAGRGNAAVAQYSQALRLAPGAVEVRWRLAEALEAAGNYGEALQQAQHAVSDAPLDAAGHARLAQMLLVRGEVEEAGRSWFKATQIEPRQPRWAVMLGQVMGELGRPVDQLALYERALALDPTLPELRAEMAWVLATAVDSMLRDPSAALRLAEAEDRAAEGSSPRAIEVRAAALAALGRAAEARQAAAEAIALAESLGLPGLADVIRERRTHYLPDDSGLDPGAGDAGSGERGALGRDHPR